MNVQGTTLRIIPHIHADGKRLLTHPGNLDRAGVLYLPDCLARLGLSGKRQNREAVRR